MASSNTNRHWPSLFKSKPCNTQWQHDMINTTLLSSACPKSSFTTSGCEERTPEPKPRWNPKPEQIKILESIFNSGMVNPPRDEIRKIRAQLQEYGQVGDANVFYWFQNRKSRSKHKLRHLQSSSAGGQQHSKTSTVAPAATSSSSSCSDRSSGSDKTTTQASMGLINSTTTAVSPTASVSNNTCFSVPAEFPGGNENGLLVQTPLQNYCYSAANIELSGVAATVPMPQSSLGIWTELVMGSGQDLSKTSTQLHQNSNYPEATFVSGTNINVQNNVTVALPNIPIGGGRAAVSPPAATGVTATITAPTTATGVASTPVINEDIQAGIHGAGATRSSIVFINGVAFEIAATALLNVREAFGAEALLLNSAGHPVPVNEWGITLHPLQHGSSYYLV